MLQLHSHIVASPVRSREPLSLKLWAARHDMQAVDILLCLSTMILHCIMQWCNAALLWTACLLNK